MASFDELQAEARKHPIITQLPSLAHFYLQEFDIYNSVADFEYDLYHPDHEFDRDVIIDTDDHNREYPVLPCDTDPVAPELNNIIAWDSQDDRNKIQADILSQSDIKQYVVDNTTSEDAVALIVIDGLSYETICHRDLPLEPVFADGLTTTEYGYRRVIYGNSNESVGTALLTDKGFLNLFGFTYWDEGQEDLSTELHQAMPETDIHRIRDFDQAVDILTEAHPFTAKTYIQITRMGFDQESHNRKERPNKETILDDILTDLKQLQNVLDDLVDDYRILMTADHGILWRDNLPDDPPVVYEDQAYHPRHIEGVRQPKHGLVMNDNDGDPVTALAYPYLARDLKHTEWGAHGGVSYYECLVPFVEATPKSKL